MKSRPTAKHTGPHLPILSEANPVSSMNTKFDGSDSGGNVVDLRHRVSAKRLEPYAEVLDDVRAASERP